MKIEYLKNEECTKEVNNCYECPFLKVYLAEGNPFYPSESTHIIYCSYDTGILGAFDSRRRLGVTRGFPKDKYFELNFNTVHNGCPLLGSE